MQKTVVALYDNLDDAQQAVRDMVDSGLPRDQISLVANDQAGQLREYTDTGSGPSGAAQGAGVGAGIGAALGGIGGLLVGLGALAIPGIGPVLAAGPLAAALGGVAGAGAGAITGGVAGGLIGSLTDMGVTEQQAGYFAEGIRRGGTLVTVRTDDDDTTERAKDTMNRHHPVDINERAGEWRETGWVGFTPTTNTPTSTNPDMPVSSMTGSAPTNVPSSEYGGTIDSGGVVTGPNPDAAASVGMRGHDFDYFETDFRNDFASTYADRNFTYDQVMPAYHYGFDLAGNTQYRGKDWADIEPDAHLYWEERHPGTWDQFKMAIQHAYYSVRDTLM